MNLLNVQKAGAAIYPERYEQNLSIWDSALYLCESVIL